MHSGVTICSTCMSWWCSSATFRGTRISSWSPNVIFPSTGWKVCNNSRSAKCSWRAGKVTSVAQRVADGLMVGFMAGTVSDRLGSAAQAAHCTNDDSAVPKKFLSHFGLSFFVPGVHLDAQRIVNDVSCVMSIYHENHVPCRAQNLETSQGESCCSAHYKWRFICDTDQSWG